MITVHLVTGLGNQFFQYAVGRTLSLKYGVPLSLDVSSLPFYFKMGYDEGHITHFNIEARVCDLPKQTQMYSSNRLFRKFLKLRDRLLPYYLRTYVVEKQFHFDPKILCARRSAYLEGYFQSEAYFGSHKDILRKELSVKNPPEGRNAILADEIRSTQAVSLHVRRGDYVNNPEMSKVHGCYDRRYYRRAVEIIASKTADPRIYVFSDDPAWVKANLKLDFPTVYVDHNTPKTNYEDLRLMSLCKHHIIANSTFSWWGAWLDPNPDKLVIAPERWFADSPHDTRDIIPKDWIKV